MMKWDNLTENAIILLNQNVTHVENNDVSILVHYWGAKSPHYNNKPHQHSFFELCYVFDGEGQYIDQGKEYPIKKGHLFLSRPYIKHQILSRTGLDIIFVGFEIDQENTKEDIRHVFSQLEVTDKFLIQDASDSPVTKLWTSLISLVHEHYFQFNDTLRGLCSAFFMSLIEQFSTRKRVQSKKKHNVASYLVYQAKLYINDNLHRRLKLSDVANHIYISERHLSRVFKSELGQTFSSYVNKERVRKAGNLLTETDLTIQEIAEMTGFENVHYFSRVFSSEMGLPPGKFRLQFKREDSK